MTPPDSDGRGAASGPLHFTLQEANELIPRIAPHLMRALQLHGLVRAATDELSEQGWRISHALLSGTGSEEDEDEEGGSDLDRARALYQAMLAEIEAVQALGVEVKGVEQGLADFRSYRDGDTEVLLCWKLGEAEIGHYHLPEAGFAGRRPVAGHVFTAEPRPSTSSGDHGQSESDQSRPGSS